MEIAKNIYSNKILKYIVIAFAGSILLTISAKIKIPFYPVPMTMQTFVVILLGITFGYKAGAAAVCLYLIEGISGLPVFSNSPEKGVGLSYFMGPTMGYLIGFIFAAVIAGYLKYNKNYFFNFFKILFSISIIYLFGFLLQSSKTLWICSHFTLSADIGFSGGAAFLLGSASNAFSTSSASAGFAR